jgi:hypothetical protein
MKRIAMISGAGLVSGVLVKASYALRELMAALALFSSGFAVLLLLLVLCFFAIRAAKEMVFWVRMRLPLWNRAVSEWIFAFRQSGHGIAKQWLLSFTRNEKIFLIEQTPLLAPSAVLSAEDVESVL